MSGLKRRIFDWLIAQIPSNYRAQMFLSLGQSVGVTSYVANGPLGLIEGNIKDRMVQGYYLSHKNWAPWFQNILKNRIFFNEKGTFVDIGANIGLTIIPIAKARKVNCIAFEPEQSNFALLMRNISLNKQESVIQAHNMALFSADQELEFELSNENMGDHRVRLDNQDNKKSLFAESSRTVTHVMARRLDGFLDVDSLQHPIVVKMDVQGSEVKVLKGAERFFEQVSYLFIEYWPYGIQRMGDDPNAFLQIIKRFPFGAIYNDVSESTELNLVPIDKLLIQINNMKLSGIEQLDLVLARNC